MYYLIENEQYSPVAVVCTDDDLPAMAASMGAEDADAWIAEFVAAPDVTGFTSWAELLSNEGWRANHSRTGTELLAWLIALSGADEVTE